MRPILYTRLFGVLVQLSSIAAVVAVAERLGYEAINPPLAVAIGFVVGLGNVLWWMGRRPAL